MQLPQIRIQSQNAMIGLRINDANVQIDSEPAKLEISQPQAEVRISTKQGKLTIDQSKALADVGIIPTEESVKRMADNAMQTAIEGSKKRRRQGDRMMEVHKNGNVLPQIAKQNGERPMKQFNIGWIPGPNGVTFHYEPAEVEVDAKANQPIIQSEQTKNQFHYQRGGVETYLAQKNWLQIDFVHVKFVGNNFEIEI
ncbi:DUF6470 family protein [Gracilibacillus marinus]|uniref:DUF6470 family protein n=1 Tax=Gracilibacillus marinus TaxID=630535 RepID=A0ABV8VRD9_9BACI